MHVVTFAIQGSWRGAPSPSLGSHADNVGGDGDNSVAEEMKKYMLPPSPFDVIRASTEAHQQAGSLAAPTPVPAVSEIPRPSSTGPSGNSAPAPSALSLLAQQFGNQTPQPPAAVASMTSAGFSSNIHDRDNAGGPNVEDDESNDSDVSDVDMEDMPFAWAPEGLADCPKPSFDSEKGSVQRDSGLPLCNTIQQLCMAPPSLISFKTNSGLAVRKFPCYYLSFSFALTICIGFCSLNSARIFRQSSVSLLNSGKALVHQGRL
jgi:hypothetical protein